MLRRTMDFEGKAIIITGASSGIGRALAVALAERGAHLALAARRKEPLEALVTTCREHGGDALAVPTDVTDPEACRVLVERTVEAFGGVDVLVNNAGISMWARFDEVRDLSVFERLVRVNYLGAVYCTHYALPHVRARRGLLVAISSLSGKTGVPTRSGYAASKHALQGFFDSLRVELRHTGVDVLTVSPGFIATGVQRQALGADGGAAPADAAPPDQGSHVMSVDACVARIVRAMERRRRDVVMTGQGKVGMFVRLVAPGLVDRIAARATGDQGGA